MTIISREIDQGVCLIMSTVTCKYCHRELALPDGFCCWGHLIEYRTEECKRLRDYFDTNYPNLKALDKSQRQLIVDALADMSEVVDHGNAETKTAILTLFENYIDKLKTEKDYHW